MKDSTDLLFNTTICWMFQKFLFKGKIFKTNQQNNSLISFQII